MKFFEAIKKTVVGLLTASVLISVINIPVSATTREEYAAQFVERMYTMVLGRTSDAYGRNYWTSGLLNGQLTGADCAIGFFESDEYKAKNKSDEQYIRTLYSVILGRTTDPEGLTTWLSYLAGGTPRLYVLAGLVNSNEYNSICNSYGITRGEIPMDPNDVQIGTPGSFETGEDGSLYFNTTSGTRLTGWQRVNGNRYYFDPADGGRAATGWTYIGGLKYYFDDQHRLVQNVDSLIGRQSSYYVTVNHATETVMIYAQETPGGPYNIPVRAMVCSSARAGYDNIEGTYPIRRGSRWGVLGNDGAWVYGQYTCQISGNYLFHSCWYHENGNPDSLSVSQYNRLGQPTSHGCIRLCVADARWIYENCAGTSNVYLFTSNEPAPFDRPQPQPAIQIRGDYGHDPTDV